MDEERREVIEKFYQLYRQLQEKYNLRMHSRASLQEGTLIEIWEHSGKTIVNYICRTEDEDEIVCYKKAINDLEYYEKSRIERSNKKAG